MITDFDKTDDEKIKNALARKAEIMLQSDNEPRNGSFGMIASLGGVIIIPILICLGIGTYLDDSYPVAFSWRLNFIFLGFLWGIINAYFWIKMENKKIIDSECAKEKQINKGLQK